jgi:hypothetical protein
LVIAKSRTFFERNRIAFSEPQRDGHTGGANGANLNGMVRRNPKTIPVQVGTSTGAVTHKEMKAGQFVTSRCGGGVQYDVNLSSKPMFIRR